MEFDINVFFQVNMRSSISPFRNSGCSDELKPSSTFFTCVYMNKSPVKSIFSFSICKVMPLWNFLLKAIALIFLLIFSFIVFFSSVGRSRRGNQTSTTMPRGVHMNLPEFGKLQWACAYWRFHATWQPCALSEDARLVVKIFKKESILKKWLWYKSSQIKMFFKSNQWSI